METAFRAKIARILREGRDLERRHADRIEAARARRQAAWNHETPDTIPMTLALDPVWSDWYFKKRYNIKIGQYWTDPKLLVEYQLRIWIDSFRDFEDDRTSVLPNAVGPLGGVVLHPSVVGCRTVFPEDDFAWIDLRRRVFKTKEMIDDFVTPEIPEAGLMPETLERLRAVENLVGDMVDVRIQGGDGSALQMAAYTRGIPELIRDMFTDPPIVDKLMRKMMAVYERIQQYYEAEWDVPYKGRDVEGLFYDNPLSYFSPALVERFVLPHYRRFAEKCGWRNWSFETQDVMDDFIGLFRTIPLKTVHSLVSSSDLDAFREALDPSKTRFGVFLSPGTKLLRSPGMEAEVSRVVNTMGREGGWVLSSGIIDAAVPEARIGALLKAVRESGRCG
jgi:hypothetical protein